MLLGVSIWTVGYVIGQIPSNLLLTRVSPRWVIPSLELGWAIATFCTASVQSYKALYALRFLVGFFECVTNTTYPCFEYADLLVIDRASIPASITCWGLGKHGVLQVVVKMLILDRYTPREIGKRAMVFWLAGSVGTMFSGFLQAAAYSNLDGVSGYAGW